MKLSLNWLKHYLPTLQASAEDISRALTFLGFEVEGVERTGLAPIPHLVVGEILTRERHPNADKLSVCTVRVAPGGAPQQIVCGAPNCDPGRRVPVALPGCVLPGDFKIKASRIRGVESAGMMCSARELGLGDDSSGLLLLAGEPVLGSPVHEAVGGGDVVFDLEVTPNRPDALSHLGAARELAAWFRLELVYPPVRCTGPAGDDASGRALLASVAVEAPEACPLYTAHAIRGVRIGPSPAWLQRALAAAGLRAINNVVDVTNFVLLETGQPLHAFDAAKIRGSSLRVRLAAAGERLVTLDGKERSLRPSDLVIADAERALVVAGIMGGADAEVDETTRDLVLESAYFSPAGVRRTSKSIGLSTDSSYRFERGVDACGVLPAARRAIDLILEVAGGERVGPAQIIGAEPPARTEIALRPAWVRERLGFDVADADQRSALERLEFVVGREEVTVAGDRSWVVTVPSWRGDIERPIDLVEEILRVYGTEKIPAARLSLGSVVGADDAVAVFSRDAAAVLVGQQFLEAVNYTLRPLRDAAEGGAPAPDAFALANPLAEDQSHLRRSLLPGLLETLRFNQARQNAEARFFETGRVFSLTAGGEVEERVSAAFVVLVPVSPRGWRSREPVDFYSAKRWVQALAQETGVSLRDEAFQLIEAGAAPWQPGHAAAAATEGLQARLGLVQPALVRALGLEGSVLAGEVLVPPALLRQVRPGGRVRAVSPFPAATRDLAILCEETTPLAVPQAALLKAARKAVANAYAVERIEVFDIYRGAGVPTGKKSLAFTLAFRAADRTLTDDEVNRAFVALQADIEAAGYPVRR